MIKSRMTLKQLEAVAWVVGTSKFRTAAVDCGLAKAGIADVIDQVARGIDV